MINTKIHKRFEAVVIGSSAGGIKALSRILAALPRKFPLSIIIVQHLYPHSPSYLAKILGAKCHLPVKEADEKEVILPSKVYIAPPNYHLLIERDKSFSLSIAPPVSFSRPAVDVLFETAADAYRHRLIGLILTGANHDGSHGAKEIKQKGGFVIVQDPLTAESDAMPRAAIAATIVDKILPLDTIGHYLVQLIGYES